MFVGLGWVGLSFFFLLTASRHRLALSPVLFVTPHPQPTAVSVRT
jgi:hypothetical protein